MSAELYIVPPGARAPRPPPHPLGRWRRRQRWWPRGAIRIREEAIPALHESVTYRCVLCDAGVLQRSRYPYDLRWRDGETERPCELCDGAGNFRRGRLVERPRSKFKLPKRPRPRSPARLTLVP